MFELKLNPKILNLTLKVATIGLDYFAESLPPDGRVAEYGYVASRLSRMTPGRALDIGCTARFNYLPATLCFSGWDVDGIDLRGWKFTHSHFKLIRGDIRRSGILDNFYDCVYALSTIEHIGLNSYYGNKINDFNGDIKAAREVWRILKPGGRFLITMPYARKFWERGGARRYDDERVGLLTKGFKELDKQFYIQRNAGEWVPILSKNIENREAIVLLDLQKPYRDQ